MLLSYAKKKKKKLGYQAIRKDYTILDSKNLQAS